MATNKLGFNGEVKELQIGKTFLKGYKEEFFHTMRYDFKPASVDTHKVGTMEVDNKEVTLSIPHIESAGSSQAAIFKGNKIPASKDCVLVIDHSTGEIVLEKISHNVRVKKIRTEKINKKNPHGIAASHDLLSHKPSPSQPFSNSSSARGKHQKASNAKGNSPNQAKSSSSFAPGSMPMLGGLDENKNDSTMSESSSDSDTGSSSSSESDSDSDQGQANKGQNKNYPNSNPHNGLGISSQKSPTSILCDLELSEED